MDTAVTMSTTTSSTTTISMADVADTNTISLIASDEDGSGDSDILRYFIANLSTGGPPVQPPDSGLPVGQLNYYYAALELTVAFAACVGNAAVIAVFCRERRLRKRTNYYIVSLAMADFLVGLLGIPFAVLASVGLPRNLYGCLLTLSTLVVLCTTSIFCLVAVSVDRYWAILYPLAYSRNVRTKTAICIISLCWLGGILVGFLPLLGWRARGAGPTQACLFVQVMDYGYLVFLYFATIILPALLLLLFYAHIYTVIMKQVRKTVTIGGPMTTAGSPDGKSPAKPNIMSLTRSQGGTMLRVLGAARKREVKATQNLSVIVLFFMICWLPLYTINCIKAFCNECELPPWATLFCIILSHLNSAMNPMLYAYHLKDFRAALKALICGVFGVKEAQRATDINYRFSVHSQNRMASRVEKLRAGNSGGGGGQQPRIYIDSPVYLRQQQASTRSAAITPTATHNAIVNSGRDAALSLHMWRILEVPSAGGDTSSASGVPHLHTPSTHFTATPAYDGDPRKFRFDYDRLDRNDVAPAQVVTFADAVGSTIGGRCEPRSLPLFYHNSVELECVDDNADNIHKSPHYAGGTGGGSGEDGAMLPVAQRTRVRRRSATTGDLVEYLGRAEARRKCGSDTDGMDLRVLCLETHRLLEHERQTTSAALPVQAVVPARQQQNRAVHTRRRRRCRSASQTYEVAGSHEGHRRSDFSEDVPGGGYQRKLSRSWSALHRERSADAKQSFS